MHDKGYKEVIIYIGDNGSLIWSCLFTIKDPLKKISNSELSTPLGVIAMVKHIWCRSFFDRKMAFFKGTQRFRNFRNSMNEEHPLLNLAQKILLVLESFL